MDTLEQPDVFSPLDEGLSWSPTYSHFLKLQQFHQGLNLFLIEERACCFYVYLRLGLVSKPPTKVYTLLQFLVYVYMSKSGSIVKQYSIIAFYNLPSAL